MLFTDGSHAPMTVQKTSAVGVNAAGGAEALTNRKVTTGQQPQQPGKHPKPGKPKTQPVEQVSNKVNCKVADQTPHIPQITGVVPGSRTVTLTWNYPLLTNQDCEPSTYQVAIKLLSSGAPTAPGSVTVQGQVGVTVANLFPSTRYSVTVTAFINAHGTTSQPLQFTTGPEGPAAPKELRVSTDNSGNWDLAWNSCGTVKEGCVPAQSWTVTPSFCDGIGISTPPAPLTLTADPTSRAQPPAVYQGSDDLLGRGLQFQVQGTGQQGQAGTPSAKSPCVYSWAPPDLTNVRLAATKPDDVPFGQTATSTVNLDLGADPVRAVGGLGAKITFVLAGPTGQQSRTVTYTGRSTDLSASFAGIDPGAQYNASALISPPRHASVVATVPPVPVVAAATWPATLAISPQCSPQGQPAISCTLAVSFSGLASAQANGEHFSLTSDSNITCQNTSAPLSLTGFDPASGVVTANLSQLQGFYGTCTVHIWLVEDGSPPFVFGGVRSPELTHDVDLGKPTYANAGPGDFALNWSSQGGSGSFAELRYTGSLSESDLGQLTQNWTETLFAPNGTQCGTANHQPGKTDQTAAYLPVDSTCIKQFGGDSGNWTVNVKYQNSVDGTTQGPFTVAQGLQGPPPGYQPCTPTGFQAAWGQAIADGVAVTVADTSKFAGCTNWQYTLNDSTSAACTSPKDNNDPSTQPPVTIPINCGTAPDNNWTVVVQWTDPAGNQHTSDPIPVTGTPPTS
jgi:hypothetical protein